MSRRGTWRSATAVALLVGVVTGGPAAARPTDPADLPEPTSSQLADSVRVWDPAGTVRVWDPEGTVSTLEQETTDGARPSCASTRTFCSRSTAPSRRHTAGPAIAALLQDVPPGAAVTILGHTDSRGDDGYNLELSQRRAEAVARAVAAARPDLSLTVEGRGETEPVAPNDSGGEDNPDGRAENRRVEIRYSA